MDKRLGFIGIIVEDRKSAAQQVNTVISAFGDLVVGRMGIPYQARRCNVITLIVDATVDEMGALSGRLGEIRGVSIRSALGKGRKPA